MLWLIDNYDSFTYNLVHYIGELGVACHVVRNDAVTVDEVLAASPEGIVLSPGPCTPNEAGIGLDLVAAAGASVPILGVCLGHQTIGQVYGAEVVRAETLMHGKLSEITHTGASLFQGLPKKLRVTRYHSLTLAPDSMPENLEVTAKTDDGIIMGLRHTSHRVHGVQFHPESIASQHGHAMLANFLDDAGIARGPLPQTVATVAA